MIGLLVVVVFDGSSQISNKEKFEMHARTCVGFMYGCVKIMQRDVRISISFYNYMYGIIIYRMIDTEARPYSNNNNFFLIFSQKII